MKREQSIHITKDRLLEIVDSLMREQKHGVSYSSEMFVNKLFILAKPYSISTRNISVSNDRLEKKVKRIINSSRVDADLFAQLIYAIRKKMKHRGISLIKPGSKDWDLVKEITASALNFCEEFDLRRREGFIQYIEIGINKMIKFNLNKFPNMVETISETYSAIQEINSDSNPEATQEMYDFYIGYIADYTGIFENLKELPDKYVWFVRARKAAEKINVPGIAYIKAQFAGLDFAKGIPHPTQLVGIKAIDRVNRYSYKRKFKTDYNENGIKRVNLKNLMNDND